MVKKCVLYTSHKIHLFSKFVEIDGISVNLLHSYSKSDCQKLQKLFFIIIHVDTFYGSKGDFPAFCAMMSFKIRNHYIVENMTIVVLSAENCCAGSMKL